jgi:hypothetical protein
LTKGPLVALLYLMVVTVCFGAVGRALPSLAQSTSDGLFVLYMVVALAGAVGIIRYLPDSKKRVF